MSGPPYVPYARPTGTNGLAVAALVLGILALCLFCVWYVSLPSAVLAIALGAAAKQPHRLAAFGGRGMANAGIACGVTALGVFVLAIVGCMTCLAGLGIMGAQLEEFESTTRPIRSGF